MEFEQANSLNDLKASTLQWDHWLFMVFFVLFSVVAISRIYYNHLIDERIKAYFATRYLKQLIRKELALYHPYSLITLILFSTTVGLVFTKGFQLYFPAVLEKYGFFIGLFVVTAGALVWIIIRAYLLKIIQFIIGFDYGQTENRYRTIIFNQISGYALLPLIFLAYFIPSPFDLWMFWAAVGLLLSNYVYRIVQSLITAVNYSANVLYLFLYLCTLEIVPLIWLFTELRS